MRSHLLLLPILMFLFLPSSLEAQENGTQGGAPPPAKPSPASAIQWEALAGLMSVGGIAGFCVGYATKKIAKIAAFAIGAGIILLQVLVNQNLISVNWTKIETATQPYLNNQGMGGLLEWFLGIVTLNMPFAGPFIIAFWIGLKNG